MSKINKNPSNPENSQSSNPEETKIKPSRYLIYFSENKIIIINSKIPEKFIQINRENNYTQILAIKELNKKYTVKKTMKFFAVFGRVDILGIPFLALISKAKIVASFQKKKIYKILSVKFLTINKNHYKAKSHEKCCEHLEKLKKYLKTGFYFSYNYNLSKKIEPEKLNSEKDIEFEINSFVWNYKSLQALAPKQNLLHFFTPIVQGYVGMVKKEGLEFLLVSRRSFLMGGTRYNSRGVDVNGHVANFVESEQVVLFQKKEGLEIFSFSQIRGSLPFYWRQVGVKAKIQIHQTFDINKEQFLKHVNYLQKKMGYENVVFFNLLGLNRGDENLLTKYLLELLQKSKSEINNIFYYHIDFHALTKETDFSSIDSYITKSFKPSKISYNHHTLKNTLTQHKVQKGIIRTNCMDCLDRTNVVQTKYSFLILYKILQQLDSPISVSDLSPLVLLEKSNLHFITDFRKIWADNGDSISKLYAGTGATTSSVTRKGEKSGIRSIFDHGIKSISRFYLNNFDDDFKQEVIDCILNTKDSSIRHSELNLNFYKDKKFSFGIVSVMSKRKNGHLEFGQEFLKALFDGLKYLNFVFFVSYVSKKRKVRVLDREGKKHDFDNFLDLFKSFSFHDFKICSDLNLKNFEIILFGKNDDLGNFGFYKDEKAKLSNFSQSLGVKSSFIINDHSVELFGLKMGKKSMEKKFSQLIEKYIDKTYDIILIIINGDENIFFDSIGKNYTLLFDQIVNFKNDNDNTNQVHFFCSNKMIEKQIEPLYRQVKIDLKGLSSEVTLNAHSFVMQGLKN